MSPVKEKKGLRSGYTTGACAAAAAKAAATLLLGQKYRQSNVGAIHAKCPPGKLPLRVESVEIPFPDGSRHAFKLHSAKIVEKEDGYEATASIIKDAGDDPDITNGAEITATASLFRNAGNVRANGRSPLLKIKGGKGVGVVTKPGLPIPIGEPAINPVPRKMIEDAVKEAIAGCKGERPFAPTLEVTITVPDGEELAKKTLNHRLGITGGISILGTTGIVKPVSADAWKATITSSMDVARAMGYKEIVLSAGRTSEKAHMKKYNLAEEAYVLMGDYLEYTLKEANAHGFKKAHLCAQWAKMLKIAMATPQTHVRFGAIDTGRAAGFLDSLGIELPQREFNTAREIFDLITEKYIGVRELPLEKVCTAAKQYAEETGGIPVTANLVSYDGKVILTCE